MINYQYIVAVNGSFYPSLSCAATISGIKKKTLINATSRVFKDEPTDTEITLCKVESCGKVFIVRRYNITLIENKYK